MRPFVFFLKKKVPNKYQHDKASNYFSEIINEYVYEVKASQLEV